MDETSDCVNATAPDLGERRPSCPRDKQMVYLPSNDQWEEILSAPVIVRLTKSWGEEGLEVTLIARCRTLEIKYIMQEEVLDFVAFRSSKGILCYGLHINDDQESPMTLWAACKSLDEFSILECLEKKQKVSFHLFNEACVNVASAEFMSSAAEGYADILENPKFEQANSIVQATHIRTNLALAKSDKNRSVTLRRHVAWSGVDSNVITTDARCLSLNLFDDEEGGHQEQLIGWLADSVHPNFLELNLKCKEPKSESEFADITMSYDSRSIIMESKALAIFRRETLPSRSDLAADVTKKIKKAARQLKGGCKSMHSQKIIFNEKGKTVSFKRDGPAHAICLIPDLSLVSNPHTYAADFCRKFNFTGDMFHLLDVAQLFRMVQAAQFVSFEFGGSPMQRLDEYLCKRHEVVLTYNTVMFDMTLEIQDGALKIKVLMGHD